MTSTRARRSPPELEASAPPPLPGATAIAETSSPRADARRPARRSERLRTGALTIVEALRLVLNDPALRNAALVPTIITAVACGTIAVVVTLSGHGDERKFHAFLVTFIALSSMPPTLLFRMWARVGVEARRALGASPGEDDPHPGASWAAVAWHESGKALRQVILVSVGLAPVIVVIEILPFLGHNVTAAVGLLWTAYWIVIDALEIPFDVLPGPRSDDAPATWFERHLRSAGARSRFLFFLSWTGRLAGRLARPWRHEVAFTERMRWECAGFGIAAAALLATPIIGLVFRAVAIVAATALVVREPAHR